MIDQRCFVCEQEQIGVIFNERTLKQKTLCYGCLMNAWMGMIRTLIANTHMHPPVPVEEVKK